MTRIEREKRTVRHMIEIYCRHKEGNDEMCPQCRELVTYTGERLSKCPFGNSKTTCRRCPVHCYRPDMRTLIRTIMKYSGPRMIIHNPIAAIRHLLGK